MCIRDSLNTQLSTKDKEWQDKLNGMAFDGKIKEAITAAKGRNAKAISALLDVEKDVYKRQVYGLGAGGSGGHGRVCGLPGYYDGGFGGK